MPDPETVEVVVVPAAVPVILAKNWIASWMASTARGWFPFGVMVEQPFPVTHAFWNEVATTLPRFRADIPKDATLMTLTPMDAPSPGTANAGP